MAGIQFDTSELRTLAADLGRVPAEAAGVVRATTQKAALNIKKDLIEEATAVGSRHFSRVAASITYTTGESRGGIWAEIGPEIGKGQGSLAWIAYFGHATTGPRFPDPAGALEREADRYGEYLAKAVADLLL